MNGRLERRPNLPAQCRTPPPPKAEALLREVAMPPDPLRLEGNQPLRRSNWWHTSSHQGGPAIGCPAERRGAFLKVPHTACLALEGMQVRQSAKP
jgi:hypothetical protein